MERRGQTGERIRKITGDDGDRPPRRRARHRTQCAVRLQCLRVGRLPAAAATGQPAGPQGLAAVSVIDSADIHLRSDRDGGARLWTRNLNVRGTQAVTAQRLGPAGRSPRRVQSRYPESQSQWSRCWPRPRRVTARPGKRMHSVAAPGPRDGTAAGPEGGTSEREFAGMPPARIQLG